MVISCICGQRIQRPRLPQLWGTAKLLWVIELIWGVVLIRWEVGHLYSASLRTYRAVIDDRSVDTSYERESVVPNLKSLVDFPGLVCWFGKIAYERF